ncbi:thiamine ABC transporter ATP-binding protein [Tolumonas lignilytica]|uniref:thiamine ABC transporter ATP-binding protein n=1 Tax=Tolumonas lignilytica TaxID=1283284 RepID=UPI0004672B22|nr:thiamine ABC transporter ATP-binding protein [Tolumonas lignilytica]
MLFVEKVQTRRQGRLFEFSLRLQPGEIGLLLGRSGSGKSTLLELLAGFLPMTDGVLLAEGQPIQQLPPAERPFTMLFQQHNLFEHLTVQQNIGLGIRANLKLSRLEQHTLLEAAERLQIQDLLARYPASLSGGQQQRVALARCLVRRKPYLLLDEPFSALDPALRQEMMQEVRRLATEQRIGVLLVSHQPQEAKDNADWLGFVDEGKLQFTAPMNALTLPPSEAFAAYLGIPLAR